MTWNKHMLKGTPWDPNKDVHPLNHEIKKLLRQNKITYKMVCQEMGISRKKLSKFLNSSLSCPEWVLQGILALIEYREFKGEYIK